MFVLAGSWSVRRWVLSSKDRVVDEETQGRSWRASNAMVSGLDGGLGQRRCSLHIHECIKRCSLNIHECREHSEGHF